MTLADRDITILGGGVAGLSAALALARRGARVAVLEQAPAIAEVGAGLQISPNGARVLRALGLAEPLSRAALPGAAVELRDGLTGARVLRLDLAARGHDGGYHLLHRADLIGLLETAARAAGVTITTGTQVLRAIPGTRDVRLEMADSTTRHAGFLVGADGLRSVLRGALNPAAAPFFTRQVAWRAVIPADPAEAEPVAQVFMAPGRHLVSYPLRGGALRNIAAFEERDAWAEEGWHHEGSPDAFRTAFAALGGPVPGWLAAVEKVHVWGLFRHEVAPTWHGPCCALIGDAAHPTLPFMAQGANMALEDAWTLAAALAAGNDLTAWQAARRPRCAAIVAAAGRNARLYHLSGPLRPLAHLGLRLGGSIAPDLPLRRFDWIYAHDVTADPVA
ncbi:MAG: FAD-dependent oxidoreductase [Alkalilacustris sp.]